MKCPKCNEEIKDGIEFCSHCGNKIEKNEENGNTPIGIMTGCAAIISALLILSIDSEFSLIKFLVTYFVIFVFVFLLIGIIYLLFIKKDNKK